VPSSNGRKAPHRGVASSFLADLLLHYAFDAWMQRTSRTERSKRSADDALVHGKSEKQARFVLDAIRARLAECGLETHGEGIAYKPPCGEIAMCPRVGRMGSIKW